jgi:hypothetical protein
VYHEGLKRLIALDEDTAQGLLATLRDQPPSVYGPDAPARIVPSIDTVPPEEATNIIEALLGLSLGRFVTDTDVTDFVEDVTSTLEQSELSDETFSDEQREAFKKRLTEFLEVDVIKTGSKAVDVLFEYEHNLRAARVLTDVRPIFGEDVEEPPVGALIVHSLKIEYMHRRDPHDQESFFVTMDSEDVDDLIQQLERAKKKAESLKSVLKAANIPHLDATER